MSKRVVCKLCQFEKDRKCGKKKNLNVKLNKRRACQLFEMSQEKAEAIMDRVLKTPRPQVFMRPDWIWDKTARKNYFKGLDQVESTATVDATVPSIATDPKHPLTGDLSRFMVQPAVPNETVSDAELKEP